MAAKQQIYRVRRNYNQWVNNQTLEDYALRFTSKASRKWSLGRVANTALGAISFLALEAIGATITMSYGFDNAVAAVMVVGAIIFFAGLPICYYAAKYGVDIDLLTRGAGFGYIGSTVTSLIYSSFTFIFFALEAAIMAKAIELVLGIPLAIGYIISSVVVIPMVFYGITFISRFQLITQPIWITLQLLPFIFILFYDIGLAEEWKNYQGSKQTHPGVNILLFGAAASIMFSLIAQIGEQVDFLRFLPEKNSTNRTRWWVALILAGPGWTIIGVLKILAGSFLAFLAIQQGIMKDEAGDPTIMYTVAFQYLTDNPQLALVIAGIFVVLSQLKINVTNAYAGSIAWSNFFSRLTHNHPGRVVWLIFNVAIALLLMELGVYQALENTLSVYAIVAVSWVGAIVADLVINKPLGLSPPHIEFKRAHLYDINPVGVGAMIISSFFGVISYLGVFGEYFHALAHFVALGCTFILVPLIAILTKSKYYIARAPYVFSSEVKEVECCVCQNHYEAEDIAFCPAYDGFICSLCCSLDARCHDSCKSTDKFSYTFMLVIQRLLPDYLADYINVRLVHFVGLLLLIASLTGVLLSLIYVNIETSHPNTNVLLEATLWKVFFILMIIAGVISWLFVLAHESQRVAQEESQTQTHRLIREIEAHEITDKKLQIAKEQAEAANNAKSRYITGISHELRTPLNTVLGYAQLMEMDKNTPFNLREQISVIKRSGEHLADLIEGLLDISKIEAGRLDLHRNPIRLDALMNQLVHMFRLQAEEKGLEFIYQCQSNLPNLVMGDEKRLRQILINLLSNAVKFTEHGQVRLSLRYRNQVAVFEIYDTGVGIPEDELERIFKPFERVRRPDTPSVAGTGLGLTITRLLTDIMGGDITVESNDDGTTFTVSLMLSHLVVPEREELIPRQICGYHGAKKFVLVVDDDASHRGLISDLLTPLNFTVVEAQDAETCLKIIKSFKPDIFLIDRLMPGIDGPTLIHNLRAMQFNMPIVMVSANANEDIEDSEIPDYDDYLIKPIKLDTLLSRLSFHLDIQWRYTKEEKPSRHQDSIKTIELPSKNICESIIKEAEIGHLNGLKSIATELEKNDSNPDFLLKFQRYIKEVKFNKIIELTRPKANEQFK